MLRTLELLKDEPIKSYEILDFKGGDYSYFLKIRATLTDESELHIREYVSLENYAYSYHWQDKDGSLRVRWDNKPHHAHLKTFPDHKHTPEPEESEEVGLEDVLRAIMADIKDGRIKK